jgi:hypothetical protein
VTGSALFRADLDFCLSMSALPYWDQLRSESLVDLKPAASISSFWNKEVCEWKVDSESCTAIHGQLHDKLHLIA